MTLAVWQATIVDRRGNVQPGAELEVRHETLGQPLATQLYDNKDGTGSPLANPLTADSAGFVRFYAPGGFYQIKASYGGSEYTLRDVAIGTAQGVDADSLGLNWIEQGWDGGSPPASYLANDALRHVGKAYICLLPHTADADSEPGVGVDWETYWALMVEDGTGSANVPYVGLQEMGGSPPGEPATPAPGLLVLFARDDHKVYKKDSNGDVEEVGSGDAPATVAPTFPQGRLTLTSGVPVMVSDTTGQTTVYYCARGGGTGSFYVPLYDGSAWAMHLVTGQLSQATTDTTKSPAAVANNSNYDLFVWLDGATYRCTRGPAWSSDTARGTGAGTTELEAVNGFLVNKVAITNGPAAQRGLYVGTIRSNGSAAIDWSLRPAAAAGGTNNRLCVWNMYNRANVAATSRESANSWTYDSVTPRPFNNSASNRISFVRGLDEDALDAFAIAFGGQTNTQYTAILIGLDSTSAGWDGNIRHPNNTAITVNNGLYSSAKGLPGLGFHYLQLLEAVAGGTATFYGDNDDPTRQQSGIQMSMLM